MVWEEEMMEAEAEDTNALRVMVEERERTLTNKLIAAVRQVQGCADCGVEPVGCNEGIGREGQCTACRITNREASVLGRFYRCEAPQGPEALADQAAGETE